MVATKLSHQDRWRSNRIRLLKKVSPTHESSTPRLQTVS